MSLDSGDGAAVVREVPVGDFDSLSATAESTGSQTILHQSVEIAWQRRWTHYYQRSRARLRGMRRMPVSRNGLWPDALNLPEDSVVQERSKPDSRHEIVYRNVCTDGDPAVSVAISPIRRCVAFGCQGGVELYWIDPQTNQSLNRWFPLLKPSEHLYFLPPRRHMDAESRLRLISSSSFTAPDTPSEDDMPSTIEATSSSAASGSRITSWFTLASSWHFRTPRGAKQQAHTLDHSHALPLSDGHHILFLDNATGLLCLGADKPLGSVHRLSRKFVLLPPAQTQMQQPQGARVFAASSMNPTFGAEVGGGVRVAAAYGDDVALYTIPADALRYSTAEQENAVQSSDEGVPFAELETLQVLRHPLSNAPAVREYYDAGARFEEVNVRWMHYLPANGEEIKSLDDVWPLQISGSVIGSLHGIAALAVQETVEEGLAVWAFSSAGVAKAWRVDDGERPVLRLRSSVDEDGVVGETTVEIIEQD